MRARTIAAVMVALLAVCPLAAQSGADVVVTRSGATVEGVLIEESPGNHLLIRSQDGALLYLRSADLLSVNHGAGAPLPDAYEDILLLRTGVILRGAVREDAPGSHVVIELGGPDDPVPATIAYADLWKIIRRPAPPTGVEAHSAQVRSEAITLKLEITLGRRRAAGGDGEAAAGALERLAEDLKAAETERVTQEIETCSDRRDREKEKVESSAQTLDEAIEELEAIAAMCEAGATRAKGPGDPAVPAGDPATPTGAQAAGGDLPAGEPTGYAQLSLRDATEALRGNAAALATHAASPAGDPALLRALEERIRTRARVDRIIGKRPGTGALQLLRIRRAAAMLPLPDREILYTTNRRRDALMGSGLNAVPFFNLGSWLQGDPAGAVVGTGAMVAGGFLIWAGFYYSDYLEPRVLGGSVIRLPESMTMVTAGSLVIGGAYVWSLVRPVFYVRKCNRLLADALGVRR